MSVSRPGLTVNDYDTGSLPVPISQPVAPWGPVTSESGRGFDFGACLEILFMHKRLIFFSMLLGILAGWIAIAVWPRSYQSQAMLTLKANVSLDPTVTTGSDLMMLERTQEESINSAIEVLRSRHVAEIVVDSLGVDAVLSGEMPVSESTSGDAEQVDDDPGFLAFIKPWQNAVKGWLFQFLLKAGVKDEIGSHELAVREVQASVRISSPKATSVIGIEARSKSPEMAQLMVQTISNTFIDEHLRGARTERAYEFFLKQSTETEVALNQLILDRSRYMQEREILSIEANRELLREQLAGIDRDLALASGELEQTDAERRDIELEFNAAEDEIVAQKQALADETWSGMRQLIYELELEEQSLSAAMTENHPRLKRVQKQLAGSELILQELDSERVDENTTPNPIKQGLQVTLQQENTLAIGLRSIIAEKLEQRDLLAEKVKELVEAERYLLSVDREIELKSEDLKAMRQKLEEARVIEQLHANKIANVHVFQPASYVERAVSPQKKILGAGCLALGLLTGITLAFLREGSSQTLRTPDDVVYRVGAPVLASFPRSKSQSKRIQKDRGVNRQLYRQLMADILLSQHVAGSIRGRSLGIIGVDVNAGASTLAANLAIVSDIDCQMKTVLVDADGRNRSLTKMFGREGLPGLAELVSGLASHDECIGKDENSEVELVSSSADPREAMLSGKALEIVQALQAYLYECDLLIVDLPAASQPDQAVALAQHLDCVLVVAESEKSLAVSTERVIDRLSRSDVEILGVVLTKTKCYLPRFVRGFVSRRT